MIELSHLRGVGSIPTHKTSARKWCERNSCTIVSWIGRGGVTYGIDPFDLPEPELRALRELQVKALSAGAYDDDAHRSFADLKKSQRQRAEHRAEIARFIAGLPDGSSWPEIARAVAERFGVKGNGERTLRRMMTDLEGVDPINWAPALTPGYQGRTATAETSEEAWQWFLSLLNEAAPGWPIKTAWGRVKRDAKGKGWAWPSYPTINRRWLAMSDRERMIIRHGREEADRRFYQPVRRDPASIKSLELVSLNGRTLDLWADFGDGLARRPTMIALVDCASGKVLDFILAQSEKAERVRDLIINTCLVHGAFDRLYPDNGSAFAGHMIAGRTQHKFRNGKNRTLELERPGVCAQLGIEITFALPKNAQAKIAERKFRDFSRQIDDGPEFKGAHSGHDPGQSPSAKVVPVPIATVEAVYRREVEAYNAETGRRSAMCNGKASYDEAFQAGLSERIPRALTDRQIKFARLDYKAVTPDRHGQFKIKGWVYGNFDTQDALLRYEGRKILVGYEPDDLSAPVVAFDPDNESLICEGIVHIERGEYLSNDGARRAAKSRSNLRKLNRKAEEEMQLLSSVNVAAALDVRPANAMPTDDEKQPSKVVQGAFKAPLRSGVAPSKEQEAEPSPSVSMDDWDDMAEQVLANARKAKLRSTNS